MIFELETGLLMIFELKTGPFMILADKKIELKFL
jgi:hypothetical protein